MWVSAVRSMVFGSAPASMSMAGEEKVGGGVVLPSTVIGRVTTAVLMIAEASGRFPSITVKVIEAGPA